MMKNKPDLIFPDWKAPSNVHGFSTLRYGGVSRRPYHGKNGKGGGFNLAMHVGDDAGSVERNREIFRALLPKEPLWLNQVHGTAVVHAGAVPGIPDADASIATERRHVCLVQTADCLPVLFCDSAGSVVAAAHAGWRGLAEGVLENTLRHMREAGTDEILAWMGPAIGPGCFEVGGNVLDVFVSRHGETGRYFNPVAGAQGKYLADIYGLARHILEKSGVSRTSGGGFCTVSDAARFYSYRRDGVTGRMAACIWME